MGEGFRVLSLGFWVKGFWFHICFRFKASAVRTSNYPPLPITYAQPYNPTTQAPNQKSERTKYKLAFQNGSFKKKVKLLFHNGSFKKKVLKHGTPKPS